MSRQLDLQHEVRETKRRDELVKALDFGIVGALENQGVELLGLSLKHDAFNCLLTVRADVGGVRSVCFIGSDCIINAFLKLQADASRGALKWKEDLYYVSGT